jgi:hypothetical protein
VTERQKARAAVSQLHPPEMLAKLASTPEMLVKYDENDQKYEPTLFLHTIKN